MTSHRRALVKMARIERNSLEPLSVAEAFAALVCLGFGSSWSSESDVLATGKIIKKAKRKF